MEEDKKLSEVFMDPSLNRPVVIGDRYLVDYIGIDKNLLLGHWDLGNNCRCLNLFTVPLLSINFELFGLNLSNQLLIQFQSSSNESLIIDLTSYQVVGSPKIAAVFQRVIQVSEELIVGLNTKDQLIYFNLKSEKAEQTVTLSAQGKELLQLENKQLLVVAQDGQLIVYNPEKKDFQRTQVTFSFQEIFPVEGACVALCGASQIQIYDLEKKVVKTILSSVEGFVSYLYLPEHKALLTGEGQKGTLKLQDIKKKKTLKTWTLPGSTEFSKFVRHGNSLIGLNEKAKCINFYEFLYSGDPKQISLTQIRIVQGEMKRVKKAAQLKGSDVVILNNHGIRYEGSLLFRDSINLIDISTSQILFTHVFHEEGFEIVQDTFIATENHQLIFQKRFNDPQAQDELVIWDYQHSREFQTKKMNFPSNKKIHFFKFDRLIVPFNRSVTKQAIAIKINIRGGCGISIYDLNLIRLIEIPIEDDFSVEVIDMPSKDHLIFVNKSQQLEHWDLTKKTRLNTYSCEPNIFKFIKSYDDYIFLQNTAKELYLWDSDYNPISTVLSNHEVQRIQIEKGTCYILCKDHQLYIFDINTEENWDAKVDFPVLDFVVSENHILLMGHEYIKLQHVSLLI